MKVKFLKLDDHGAPTGFPEKVLAGIYASATGRKGKQGIMKWHDTMVKKGVVKSFLNTTASKFSVYKPQFHTMLSLKSRIAVGNEIEYSIPISKSKTVEFAPKGKVVAIQYVKLKKSLDSEAPYLIEISNDKKEWGALVESSTSFSVRNGFDSTKDMFDYFIPEMPKEGESLEVKRKLVHWTDFFYTAGKTDFS